MSLLILLRHLFMLLLAVLIWSLILEQSVALTAGIAACSGVGWRLGRQLCSRSQLACQITRAVVMVLALTGCLALPTHAQLEPALLAYCGCACGLMIGLTSPRSGRRPWRSRVRQLQISPASSVEA